MLISIAVAMNLDLLHVDIPQAFVQSKIDAPVYMRQLQRIWSCRAAVQRATEA